MPTIIGFILHFFCATILVNKSKLGAVETKKMFLCCVTALVFIASVGFVNLDATFGDDCGCEVVEPFDHENVNKD